MLYVMTLPNGRTVYTTSPVLPEVLPDLDQRTEATAPSRGLDSVEYVQRSRLLSAEEKRFYFTDCLPLAARGWMGEIVKESRAKRETAEAISYALLRRELVNSGELKPFVGKSRISKRCKLFPRCPIGERLDAMVPIEKWWKD